MTWQAPVQMPPPPTSHSSGRGTVLFIALFIIAAWYLLNAESEDRPVAHAASADGYQPAQYSNEPSSAGEFDPSLYRPEGLGPRETAEVRSMHVDASGVQVGWTDGVPDAQHRNHGVTEIDGGWRIPLGGLASVHQQELSGIPDGRAIVAVPQSIDWTRPVTVLVHLHGYNAGYKSIRGRVHDVETDQIVQQVAATPGNLIAALPQGTRKSGFSPSGGAADRDSGFSVDTFVREVLSALVSLKITDRAIVVRGVVLSAHSGGGNALAGGLNLNGNEWERQLLPAIYRLSGVLLFDAINSERRLNQIIGWTTGQIADDIHRLRRIRGVRRQLRWLRRRPHLRAVFAASGAYRRRYYALQRAIREKLGETGASHEFDPQVVAQLNAHYRVDAVKGRSHATIVGTGAPSDNGAIAYGSDGRVGALQIALESIPK